MGCHHLCSMRKLEPSNKRHGVGELVLAVGLTNPGQPQTLIVPPNPTPSRLDPRL